MTWILWDINVVHHVWWFDTWILQIPSNSNYWLFNWTPQKIKNSTSDQNTPYKLQDGSKSLPNTFFLLSSFSSSPGICWELCKYQLVTRRLEDLTWFLRCLERMRNKHLQTKLWNRVVAFKWIAGWLLRHIDIGLNINLGNLPLFYFVDIDTECAPSNSEQCQRGWLTPLHINLLATVVYWHERLRWAT